MHSKQRASLTLARQRPAGCWAREGSFPQFLRIAGVHLRKLDARGVLDVFPIETGVTSDQMQNQRSQDFASS